jgi:hypothetical protein
VLGYPIGLQVGRNTVAGWTASRWGWGRRVLFSAAWIGSSLLLACLVADIAYVLVFVGATTPMAFIFVFPTVMLARSFASGWQYWVTRVVCVLFCLSGATFAITAVVATFV